MFLIKEIEFIDYNEDEVIIEMSYYYADMAAKVRKEDINKAVLNIMSVLNSIQYNDDVIKNSFNLIKKSH